MTTCDHAEATRLKEQITLLSGVIDDLRASRSAVYAQAEKLADTMQQIAYAHTRDHAAWLAEQALAAWRDLGIPAPVRPPYNRKRNKASKESASD